MNYTSVSDQTLCTSSDSLNGLPDCATFAELLSLPESSCSAGVPVLTPIQSVTVSSHHF